MDTTMTTGDTILDRRQECRPCSPDDALRFIRDMDGDSPAVRLMLQWEHMLLDGTEYTDLLDGEGASEQSRLRIIAFTQMLDSDDTNDLASIDENLQRLPFLCIHADSEFKRIMGGSDRDMGRIVHTIWTESGGWGNEPGSGADLIGWAFEQPPSMMAGYAIGNAWWASGMADLLQDLRAWSASLVGSGRLEKDEAKTSMIAMVSRIIDSAFGSRTAGDMVSPAALIMSMAVNRHVDDDGLASMREHWAADLPDIGFGLLRTALREMMKAAHVLAGPVAQYDDDLAMAGQMSRCDVMFAAITDPMFASDPDRAVFEAGQEVKALMKAKPAGWSAAQSWNSIRMMPLMPSRILKAFLRKRIPLTALSTVSWAYAAMGESDVQIVDNAFHTDWHDVTVKGVMLQAGRMFPCGDRTAWGLYDREHTDAERAGETFRRTVYDAMRQGDNGDAACTAFLEQVVSGTCIRSDDVRKALEDDTSCDAGLIIDSDDLAETVKDLLDGMLPPEFLLQNLAAKSMTFTQRSNVRRWEQLEMMGYRTRLFSFDPPADSSQSDAIKCHVGVY